MTAVNYYARATAIAAKRGERGSSTIVAQLSPGELRDHDAIIDVRHRALTHVTPNATLAGGEVWNEQKPLAFDVGDGWKVGFATRHAAFRVDLLDKLHRQIPVAEQILAERFQDKLRIFGREVKKAPGWDEALRKYALNPVKVFGSVEAAARAMTPIVSGETTATFFTRDPSFTGGSARAMCVTLETANGSSEPLDGSAG